MRRVNLAPVSAAEERVRRRVGKRPRRSIRRPGRGVVGPVAAAAVLTGGLAGAVALARRRGDVVIFDAVDVDVPVQTAYDQWTQFEEFPGFMAGVEEVRQLDDTRLRWTARVAGRRREWEARIVEQTPDERIAWTSSDGPRTAGVVTFQQLGEGRTRVSVQLEYEPAGGVEHALAAAGVHHRRVHGDLARFKDVVERRGAGHESGAWRGSVDAGAVTKNGGGPSA